MANEFKAKVICPHCGKEETVTIHTLLDSTRDTALEGSVLSGEVFSHTCSFCHEEFPMDYSCLYHDGKRKLLIFFAADEKNLIEMRARVNGKYENDRLEKTLNEWMEHCTVRIVTSEYLLQEKILIAHFDLDDRVIEIARTQIEKELMNERNDVKGLLFNTGKDGFEFLILSENGIDGAIPFTDEMYEEIKNRYPALSEDTCYEIDRLWAENYISVNYGIS